ncbi:MAG: IPTL-CTERM sorting domain-containing protein [Acidobacteriota bacterium]
MSITLRKNPGLPMSGLRRGFAVALSAAAALALVAAAPTLAGGHPDPGAQPLTATNSNQLMGLMGPDRGFFSGDYVTNALDPRGLQTRLGAGATYDYFFEVPPAASSSTLTIEIFDADTGAGSVGGTEAHDQDNNDGSWDMVTRYELFDPDDTLVASLTLQARDCDPVTVGLQTACDNAWTAFPGFSIASPVAPGHWRLEVSSPNGASTTAAGNEDDNNTYGVRASSAGGSEINVYARTYVGLGEVFDPQVPSNPGFGRTHDLYPLLARGCRCSFNNFDSDGDGDETLAISTRPAGVPGAITPTPTTFDLSTGNSWFPPASTTPVFLDGFTSSVAAEEYGLWQVEWFTGEFNFIVFFMGHDDPGPTVEDSGVDPEPNEQPEDRSMRLYLPASGSTFFEGNESVVAPTKPRVGHSWELVAGEPGLAIGVTSRLEVTIQLDNPTAFPIQFDALTSGSNVVSATVPTNGGQTAYVAGSATIIGGSSTATSEVGGGPWDLTFAPGVIAAGASATLTYRIDVTPSAVSALGLDLTGDDTVGSFLDETCADPAGGASACSASAQTGATYAFGPLCELSAPVTGSIGVSKVVSSGPVDNNDGTFTVGFNFLVENFGIDDLTNVQVEDDLSAAFPAPAAITAVGPVTAGGTLTANGSYNGIGDINLLDASSSTLAVGAAATISVAVTFDPNGLPGPFFNQAIASGDTPTGTVSDPSDDGTDPDPNGNGNPSEAGENDPTPVGVPESPAISIVKTAGAVTDAPTAGQFDVTFSLQVTNTGNVDLSQLQVTDDLGATFPAPSSAVSASASCVAGSCGTIAVDYTGPADTTLLDAAASGLAQGLSATLELVVRFDSGGASGPFTNTATATGLSPQAASVQDVDSTAVSITESPAITLVKTAGAVIDSGLGLFDVVFTLEVTNGGNVLLDSLQVVDDLGATFPAGVNLVSASASCVAGSCGTIAVDFTGPADTTLLDAASSSLAPGDSITLELSVSFEPGSEPGPFTNSATASGTSPQDVDVSDADSVEITLPPPAGEPVIGVAKEVVGPVVDNGNSTFTVTFRITVENLGALDLTDVQVTDDLGITFPAPAAVILVGDPVTSITTGPGALMANMNYDGLVDVGLLDPAASSLDVGAGGEIVFDVTFDPAGETSFLNSALAEADSSGGMTSDISDNGDETDSDNDGDPTEDGENDPTPILVGVSPVEIPTLDAWGFGLLAGLLALGGALTLRRRSL